MAGVEGIEPSSKVLETSILTVGRHPYKSLTIIHYTVFTKNMQPILRKKCKKFFDYWYIKFVQFDMLTCNSSLNY